MTREEKLSYVSNLANELMQKFTYESSPLLTGFMIPEDRTKNLIQNGWRFQWSRGKKRIGQCCYGTKTIEISYLYTENVADPELLRNTILHEIAHALTPGHHHDAIWKKACIAVGARPERCCNDPAIVNANKSVVPGWKASCGVCNTTHKMFRKPKYINNMVCTATFSCRQIKKVLIWEKE